MFYNFFADPVICSNFTRDGQCFLAASENIIRLMDTDTGGLLSEYRSHNTKDYLIECCSSLKDKYILSGATDGKIWCWEIISNTNTKCFSHLCNKVAHSISAHPTEESYVTAVEGSIYLWVENSYG